MRKGDNPSIRLDIADAERTWGIGRTEKSRAEMGQFFTPPEIADIAASLFSPAEKPASLLDLGAGTGILSAYAAAHMPVGDICAVELDPNLETACRRTLESTGSKVEYFCGDALTIDLEGSFDRAILNPPYKKGLIEARFDPAGDPVRVPNTYAAFLVRAVSLLKDLGEVVAIVPRSWMSGAYYAAFRRALLDRCSLDAIAVLSSRTDAFSDFGVLQEVCIVKLTKGGAQGSVAIADDVQFGSAPTYRRFGLADVVSGEDMVIATSAQRRVESCLLDAGLRASTGKIVMHRNGAAATVCNSGNGDEVALIQPENLVGKEVVHPSASPKKPQWLPEEAARGFVLPPGDYVLVRRFAPKESEKRVRGYLLHAAKPVAVENHVNVIHSGGRRQLAPLSASQAEHVLEWVNSDSTERYFRQFAATTQVNAGDLNRMPFGEMGV